MGAIVLAIDLTREELAEFARCELELKRYKSAEPEAAEALRRIHDNKYFRTAYGSFEAYLEGEWDWSLAHGKRLVAFARTRINLAPMGAIIPMPTNERQTREIAGESAEMQREMYGTAVHRNGGIAPTGAQMAAVAAEYRATPNAHSDDEDERAAAFLGQRRGVPADDFTNPGDTWKPDLVVTRANTGPMIEADEPKAPPHDEWYTRPEHVAAVHEVMGGIDLDPASCARANATVKARQIWTKEDDGLAQRWKAKRLFLNPPYLRLIAPFVAKLLSDHAKGDVLEAILLVNANTGSSWFEPLYDFPVCLVKGRIRYEDGTKPATDDPTPARADSAFVYLGPNVEAFVRVFSQFGAIVRRLEVSA